MLNRSEILRSAWASYRRDAKAKLISRACREAGTFDRKHFAYCLRMAWLVAKQEAHKAARPAPVVVLKPVSTRVEALRIELQELEYADRLDWTRHTALSVEMARLSA